MSSSCLQSQIAVLHARMDEEKFKSVERKGESLLCICSARTGLGGVPAVNTRGRPDPAWGFPHGTRMSRSHVIRVY